MAKDDIGGVWRTVGGRRIFIKDGQDLASAMKESGKFGNKIFEETIETNDLRVKTIEVTNYEEKQDYYDEITKENIHEEELSKVGLKYEVGTIIDKEGNVLDTISGESHAVDLNEEQLRKCKNAIFTHNHPTGFCFSSTDLYSYLNNDLYELRASTDSGIVYSLRKGDGKVDGIGFAKQFVKDNPNSASNTYKELAIQAESGKIAGRPTGMDLLRINGELMDKWLEENSKKYGFVYKKER